MSFHCSVRSFPVVDHITEWKYKSTIDSTLSEAIKRRILYVSNGRRQEAGLKIIERGIGPTCFKFRKEHRRNGHSFGPMALVL